MIKSVTSLALLVLSLCCVFYPHQVKASDYLVYYVDGSNGNDNNNGLSPESAFKTIKKGVGVLQAIDQATPRKLYILEGIYTNFGEDNDENIVDITKLYGSPTHPVIIQGVGDVVIAGYKEDYADINLGVEVAPNRWKVGVKYCLLCGNNPRFVTIENLIFIGGHEVMSIEGKDVKKESDYEEDPYIKEGGSFFITVNNCTFANQTHYLGFFKGYNLHDFYFNGNRWIGNPNPAYSGGTTHNIYWNAGSYGGPNSYNIEFVGNEFMFAQRWGIQFNAALVHHIVIRDNIFHHNDFGGVQFFQTHHAVVENNLFYNNNRQGLVIWNESGNISRQTDAHGIYPGRTAEPCHDIIVRNNTFDGPAQAWYTGYWFNSCPSSEKCKKHYTQGACLADGCHWYYPEYDKCMDGDTPPPPCWDDDPRWEGPYMEEVSYFPLVKVTVDSGLYYSPYSNFYNIEISNNVFSSYYGKSIEWVHTNPLCSGCNNKIFNNVYHSNDPDNENIGLDLYVNEEEAQWYEVGQAQDLFPDLIKNSVKGDPLYVHTYNIPTVKSLWPMYENNPKDPTPAPQSVWLHHYPALMPMYKGDLLNNYHYQSEASAAVDIVTSNFPELDLDHNERPTGIAADAGCYEYQYDDCPDDPNKTAPGICGCGTPDDDTDGDSVPDCLDGCPQDSNKLSPGICGCGIADVDNNNNGILDCLEEGTNNGGGEGGSSSIAKEDAVPYLKKLRKGLKKYKRNLKQAHNKGRKKVKKAYKELISFLTESEIEANLSFAQVYSVQYATINKTTKASLKRKKSFQFRIKKAKKAIKAIKSFVKLLLTE